LKEEKAPEAGRLFLAQTKKLRLELIKLVPLDEQLQQLAATGVSRLVVCKGNAIVHGCHQFILGNLFQEKVLGIS